MKNRKTIRIAFWGRVVYICAKDATLAQLVERLTCNEDVVSSTLTGGSTLKSFA